MNASPSSPSFSSPAIENLTLPTLRPASSAAFKRENRRRRKERKRLEKLQLLLDDWAPLADPRRTSVDGTASVSLSQWPTMPETDQNREFVDWNLNPRPRLPEPSWPHVSAGGLAQVNALRLCREFLSTEDCSDEEYEADDGRNVGKSYEFFKGLFDKEEDLLGFYRKDWEHGEFYCIVCQGIGDKLGKKFVSLAALLQHANFISKTKRKRAHRAYGRVVCELLGLEMDGCKSVKLNQFDVHSQDGMEKGGIYPEEVASKDAGEDGMVLIDSVEMKNVDAL